MRSLTRVRSRVHRLASRLDCRAPAGCPQCRDEEDTTKILVVYGDEVAKIPPEARCGACGRVIAKKYLTVRYNAHMRPPEEPTELPEECDP